MALFDKIRGAKEKLERKTYQKKAESRARERRIERREPEGALESAVVTGKETAELGSQAREFVSESTPGGGEATKKAGGILSSIGEGGANVMDDIESGKGIDPVSLDSNGDSNGMDMDMGMNDLDMDLEDFD